MKRIAPLLCLCLFAPLIHSQSVPSEGCTENAFLAIAAFEKYVDPKNNEGAEWIETRCVRRDEGGYHMELIANCNDADSSTANLIVISSSSMKCTTGTNKNAKCNEYIPMAGDSISLSSKDVEAWENELTGICELYVYTPSAAR